jgi:hypothetical protein
LRPDACRRGGDVDEDDDEEDGGTDDDDAPDAQRVAAAPAPADVRWASARCLDASACRTTVAARATTERMGAIREHIEMVLGAPPPSPGLDLEKSNTITTPPLHNHLPHGVHTMVSSALAAVFLG